MTRTFVTLLAIVSLGILAPRVYAQEDKPQAAITMDAGLHAAAPAPPDVPSMQATATLPDPEKDPGSFAEDLWKAGSSHNYRLLVALVLVAFVAAVRRWAAKLWPWLATDRGGVAVAMVLGLAGAFANGLAAGAHFTLRWIYDGLMVAAGASGIFVMFKRLIWPKLSEAPGDGLLEPEGASKR